MATVPDGTYSIDLPAQGGSITDAGQGRYVNLLPPGVFDPDAHKIKVAYKPDRAGYALQFEKSGKYITWQDEPQENTKLVTGDKPRYFKIAPHDYQQDMYLISTVEDRNYHVGMAMELIYPPWVALSSFREKQAWAFQKI